MNSVTVPSVAELMRIAFLIPANSPAPVSGSARSGDRDPGDRPEGRSNIHVTAEARAREHPHARTTRGSPAELLPGLGLGLDVEDHERRVVAVPECGRHPQLRARRCPPTPSSGGSCGRCCATAAPAGVRALRDGRRSRH